jgi:uncharacterized protein (DUF302 family)
MTNPPAFSSSFEVSRLHLPVAESFLSFVARYEETVPQLDAPHLAELESRQVSWQEMLAFIEVSAPHGFLIYWKNDVHPVMSMAGDDLPCVAYLMGNHTIAERMFRFNPLAMMYAPLRTVIWEDRSGQGWFAIDRPSTLFASLGDPAIAAVGDELDVKLFSLLRALDLTGFPQPSS